MKVILRDDVSGLGRKGDQIDVASGYFRNYLGPKGLAMRSTAGIEAQAEAMRLATARRHAADRSEAERVASALVPLVFTVKARAGEGGKLFGSVAPADIAAAISEQAGFDVDRATILLETPLKELGTSTVICKLHDDVEFPITVEVVEA